MMKNCFITIVLFLFGIVTASLAEETVSHEALLERDARAEQDDLRLLHEVNFASDVQFEQVDKRIGEAVALVQQGITLLQGFVPDPNDPDPPPPPSESEINTFVQQVTTVLNDLGITLDWVKETKEALQELLTVARLQLDAYLTTSMGITDQLREAVGNAKQLFGAPLPQDFFDEFTAPPPDPCPANVTDLHLQATAVLESFRNSSAPTDAKRVPQGVTEAKAVYQGAVTQLHATCQAVLDPSNREANGGPLTPELEEIATQVCDDIGESLFLEFRIDVLKARFQQWVDWIGTENGGLLRRICRRIANLPIKIAKLQYVLDKIQQAP